MAARVGGVARLGAEHGLDPERLAIKPEDLGVRITYLVSDPVSATSLPDCDFAVPFAWPLATTRR